jgi:hypothetical protein
MDRLRSFYASLRALLALGMAHSASAPAAAQTSDPDRQAFERAMQEGTPEAFQSYLDAFPLGRYATDAFRELVARSLGSRTLPEPAAGPVDVDPARPRDLY